MDPGRAARRADRDWEEHEKITLFAEILMQAIDSSALGGQIPAPSTILLQAIQQFGVIPNFEDLTLPKRRSMRACRQLFQQYVQPQQFGYPPPQGILGQNQAAGIYDQSRKRPYPVDSITGARPIAPRPSHTDSNAATPRLSLSAGPMTPTEGPSVNLADSSGRRKRGRPTKLEQQKRQQEAQALARSTQMGMMPGSMPTAPFSPGHAHRHSIAGPPIGPFQSLQPLVAATTPQRPPTEASTGSGGSEGKRRRGRPPKLSVPPEPIMPPLQLATVARRTVSPRDSRERKEPGTSRSPSIRSQQRSPEKGIGGSFVSQTGELEESSKGRRRIWEDAHDS